MRSCIVSAYYKIPSKKPHTFYREHLKRWFRSITQPIVFFTTPDVQSEIEEFGYSTTHIHFVHLPFEELVAWSILGRSFWVTQCNRDAEKYHTPEVAAIWYEKKEFVRRAMELTNADVFIWCDAGCIRDKICEEVAHQFGTRCLDSLNNGCLHLQNIRTYQTKSLYTYPDIGVACAIMAGNRDAWRNHSILYDNVVQKYDDAQTSCNSDQYVTMTCTQIQPELYTLHRNTAPSSIDEWFFFIQTL